MLFMIILYQMSLIFYIKTYFVITIYFTLQPQPILSLVVVGATSNSFSRSYLVEHMALFDMWSHGQTT